jgi:hypothetical protein
VPKKATDKPSPKRHQQTARRKEKQRLDTNLYKKYTLKKSHSTERLLKPKEDLNKPKISARPWREG